MAVPDLTVKRKDTAPAATYTVTDSAGDNVDFGSTATVTFTLATYAVITADLVGTNPLIIDIPNKRWVATLEIGDTLRIEYGNLNEELTITAINYSAGQISVSRDGDPNDYYAKGSKLWFTKVVKQAGTIEDTTVVDPDTGAITTYHNILTYSWLSADTEKIGEWKGQFEVTKADATVQSYPTSDYLTVRIEEDIDH